MTVFAVMTAGLFPIIHIGRQWIFYWLLPYPNQRYLWPNFKSPLIWDVFAISTYLTVSTTFLVFGLIPDVAAVRDKVSGWRKMIYSWSSVGWQGTDNQWRHYSRAYLYLASCPGTSPPASSRAGMERSSPRTSWPARFTPGSAWCSP
jgi:molybdopterin-containing oxidoreductase family membrane subunit